MEQWKKDREARRAMAKPQEPAPASDAAAPDETHAECERLAGALAGCGVLAHSRNPDTDCGIYAEVDSVQAVQKVVAELAALRTRHEEALALLRARYLDSMWMERRDALLAAEEPKP